MSVLSAHTKYYTVESSYNLGNTENIPKINADSGVSNHGSVPRFWFWLINGFHCIILNENNKNIQHAMFFCAFTFFLDNIIKYYL